jgi:hypothetical protein
VALVHGLHRVSPSVTAVAVNVAVSPPLSNCVRLLSTLLPALPRSGPRHRLETPQVGRSDCQGRRCRVFTLVGALVIPVVLIVLSGELGKRVAATTSGQGAPRARWVRRPQDGTVARTALGPLQQRGRGGAGRRSCCPDRIRVGHDVGQGSQARHEPSRLSLSLGARRAMLVLVRQARSCALR